MYIYLIVLQSMEIKDRPPCMTDLVENPLDVFILDIYNEVYVWVGALAKMRSYVYLFYNSNRCRIEIYSDICAIGFDTHYIYLTIYYIQNIIYTISYIQYIYTIYIQYMYTIFTYIIHRKLLFKIQ